MNTRKCEFCGNEFEINPKHKKQRFCSIGCSKRFNIEDISERKYGRLYVVSRGLSLGKRGRTVWNCVCDCGTEKLVEAKHLINGHTLSCGCLQKELLSARRKGKFGEATFNKTFYSYKHSAEKRGYTFNISIDQFKELTSHNCHYCGAEPSKEIKNDHNVEHGSFIYNGIDRIDNSIGYEIDNVVTCCEMCNRMKHAYTQENFLSHIKEIYEFNFIKNPERMNHVN